MPDTTAHLALPFIMASQAQKHVTHNEALRLLDGIVQLSVLDRDLTASPGSPTEGARYIPASGATGAWAGWDGSIAYWIDGAWMRILPAPGWLVWVEDEAVLQAFDGAAWISTAPTVFQNMALLGVGATADATNRLSVAAPATLFNHEGAGHQPKVNKAAATDTASLLFQTDWSGRAEMGTAGSDDFALKVSPDGSTWHEALVLDRATGNATLKQAAAEALTGAAVMQSALDATPGRVAKLSDDGGGMFGIGSTSATGPTEITDFTAELVPGLYRYVENTALGAPGVEGSYARYALVARTNSGHPGAFVWRRTANPANLRAWIAARATATGALTFSELLVMSRLLGTVSHTSGMPTGAVLQRGANSNGLFERRASGWMDCARTDLAVSEVNTAAGSVFRSATVTWTFPSAFLAGEAPVVSLAAEHGDAIDFSVVSLSHTAVSFRINAHTAISGAVPIRAAAKGRWSTLS